MRAVGAHRQRGAQRFLAARHAAETATTSVAMPFSLSRTASSTAISSNGFIDILTLARSTPAVVRFDPDLDVEVDHPFDGNQDFHDPKTP